MEASSASRETTTLVSRIPPQKGRLRTAEHGHCESSVSSLLTLRFGLNISFERGQEVQTGGRQYTESASSMGSPSTEPVREAFGAGPAAPRWPDRFEAQCSRPP